MHICLTINRTVCCSGSVTQPECFMKTPGDVFSQKNSHQMTNRSIGKETLESTPLPTFPPLPPSP